jgi:hypothetical protein
VVDPNKAHGGDSEGGGKRFAGSLPWWWRIVVFRCLRLPGMKRWARNPCKRNTVGWVPGGHPVSENGSGINCRDGVGSDG